MTTVLDYSITKNEAILEIDEDQYEYNVDFGQLEDWMRSKGDLNEIEMMPSGMDWDDYTEKVDVLALLEYDEKYGLECHIINFIDENKLNGKLLMP